MAGMGKKYDYIVTFMPYELLRGEQPHPRRQECMDVELAFTSAHRAHLRDHPAIREAHCLKALFPAGFQPIAKGDCFAGWLHFSAVGLGQEGNSGGVAYYCYDELLDLALEKGGLSPEKQRQVREMKEYWETRVTFGGFFPSENTVIGRMMPKELKEIQASPLGGHGDRLAGICLDMDKLVRLGLNGLIDEARGYLASACEAGKPFYQGVIMALETVQECCRFYARQARWQATEEKDDAGWKAELDAIAEIMDSIAVERPRSFRAALQLMWLYQWCAAVFNFSRIDIAACDLLASDLDSGAIDEAEAQRLTNNLWRMIARTGIVMNGRVVVGGKGRRNEKNADRFAALAIEASRQVAETEPQLTLRFYEGQNPTLMKKALDTIGEGAVYPMLFNDDANIPSVMNSFRCTEEDAEWYLPYGCGELGLEHLSVGSPNTGFTPMSLIEGVIFNGKTTFGDRELFKTSRTFEELKTFEEFYGECKRLMHTHFRLLSARQRLEHDANCQEAAYLLSSALTDDCMARGLSMNGGGARYLGGVIETFGLVNACDALAAIKKLIYEDRAFTKEQLREMLYEDWEGFEEARRLFLGAPKFGNDDDYADGVFKRFCDDMCDAYNLYAPEFGLSYFLACNVNNRENVRFGAVTPATPDGRKAWAPLANGNAPTSSNDRNGVTAVLASMAKSENKANAGFAHNMKFSKGMFRDERPKAEMLLDAYFKMGGASLMITCVGRDDLQDAQRNPESHRNLMVRVGGFSARFVELEPEVQDDIIKRTIY
jgi:pyruvate-formate lyase